MTYSARVILDSMAPLGVRLTTMECRYPRFIHSEMLTHRAFARNSASSRAIPFERMQHAVIAEPVEPLTWQLEQGGMQGVGELPEALRSLARAIWLRARDKAVQHAEMLREISRTARRVIRDAFTDESVYIGSKLTAAETAALKEWVDWAIQVRVESSECGLHPGDMKLHKTMCNRLVEPWMWITVLITATDWQNFFRLRCHQDAEQHMQRIAYLMRDAYEASRPFAAGDGY